MDSKAQQIVNKLLEIEISDSARTALEKKLEAYPEIFASYIRMRGEYLGVFPEDPVEANPYMYQKVKLKILEGSGFAGPWRIAWLPYAAIISFGIVSGVLLGNQVVLEDEVEVTELSEEFIISDYELEDAYLIGYDD